MPNHKSECPYIKRKYSGDESVDLCEINDKFCLLESGLECDTWNEVQREWAKEAAADEAYYETVNYPGEAR